MLNVISPYSVVSPDGVTTVYCPVPDCHCSFQTTKPVPVNVPYVCRAHSLFTASKCWATDLD
jgi:hypothetical protein